VKARAWRRALVPGALTLMMAGALVGGRAARSARLQAEPVPSSPFIGTWTFHPDAHLVASCGGDQPLLEPLGGATVAISAGADGSAELFFDLGCHCHLPLAVSPSDPAVATLVAPAPCELVLGLVHVTTEVQKLTLTLTAGDAPALDVDLLAGQAVGDVMCDSTSVTTTLLASSRIPADCGPESTALGILAYQPNGFGDCPLGAGRDSVQIRLFNEIDTSCSEGSGSRGEAFWVLPQTGKYEPSCVPSSPSLPGGHVRLPFCRVDGRSFKALTADPAATDQFYALLKLGDAPCPASSVEMVRKIDDEDDLGDAMAWTALGHLGPNQTATAADSTTTLHFCFFRWAAAGEETMAAFPDLGFPYAVFHDFDGPQPSWVTLKRWVYSSDEDSTNRSGLTSPTNDEVAVGQFQAVIERPNHATTFDIARVR